METALIEWVLNQTDGLGWVFFTILFIRNLKTHDRLIEMVREHSQSMAVFSERLEVLTTTVERNGR